ncbi:hypothetical protein Pelo_19859 [Pelomyxa schiedti]|nr:hypothetical protein Pelo_19859 [Pelomyxa schiedti]
MRARQLKFTESKRLPRSETDIVDRAGIKVESESVPANSPLTSDLVLTQIGEFCRSLPASTAVKPEEPAAEEVPSATQTTATATTTTSTSTTTTSPSEIPKTSDELLVSSGVGATYECFNDEVL